MRTPAAELLPLLRPAPDRIYARCMPRWSKEFVRFSLGSKNDAVGASDLCSCFAERSGRVAASRHHGARPVYGVTACKLVRSSRNSYVRWPTESRYALLFPPDLNQLRRPLGCLVIARAQLKCPSLRSDAARTHFGTLAGRIAVTPVTACRTLKDVREFSLPQSIETDNHGEELKEQSE